jgi:hypothetical protein
MSQKEIAYTLGHQEVGESSIGNLSKLAGLARQAYEQKRTKDCLDLTRAILLIDPDNADAQWMRSSVQSQIQQDLENARAFLQQAQSKDSPEAESVAAPVEPAMALNSERESTARAEDREPLRLIPGSSGAEDSKTPWVGLAGVLVFFGLFLGTFIRVIIKGHPARPVPQVSTLASSKPTAAAVPEPNSLTPTPSADPGSAPPAADAVPPSATIVIPPTAEQRLAAEKSAVPPLPAPRPVAKQEGKGTLAVSSPTSVDIYEGDQYLGSAPVSLELPAGMHTLEYRHGNLRKTATHIVNANEIGRTMIAFDATVQINSRPWAEVFLDGADRKDLGQTPLSGVRIPIGSVLIFQNPQFQSKKYRVTGNETGIQIVFP